MKSIKISTDMEIQHLSTEGCITYDEKASNNLQIRELHISNTQLISSVSIVT
jgi:hypothetical protein